MVADHRPAFSPSMPEPLFKTITADDWRRSIIMCRAMPNVVQGQIRTEIVRRIRCDPTFRADLARRIGTGALQLAWDYSARSLSTMRVTVP